MSVLPPPYDDERLVEPEAGEEVVRGRQVHVTPAKAPRADRHCVVDLLVASHIEPSYVVSSGLLTRAGPRSDFATDTCIRRVGIDPRTGSRHLEELAIEIVDEQSMRSMVERAEELTACGVRRVLAIFVTKGTIGEWSAQEGRWISLNLDGALDDPTLVRPIPLRAFFDRDRADDAVVRALDAKGVPRLAMIRAQVSIETACTVLDIPLDSSRRQYLAALDLRGLQTLLAHLETERRWP